MVILLTLTVIISYVLLQAIEMISLGSRVAGRLSGRLALGTTLHQSIYTASRFLLIPFLPSLAFLIESGIHIERYVLLVILSLFISFLMALLILIKLNTFQHFFQKVFHHYDDSHIPIALLKSFAKDKNYVTTSDNIVNFSIEKTQIKKVATSFFAYLFLANGFFVSFLFAINFPEYRLTLSQFTAAFHGIGALIVAFYLDPMLSRSLDKAESEDSWSRNVYSILYGRVLSYICVCIIFTLAYLVLFLF